MMTSTVSKIQFQWHIGAILALAIVLSSCGGGSGSSGDSTNPQSPPDIDVPLPNPDIVKPAASPTDFPVNQWGAHQGFNSRLHERDIVRVAHNSEHQYVVAENILFRSTDDAKTWQAVSSIFVNDFVPDMSHPQVLYVTTKGSKALLRSRDGGANWETILDLEQNTACPFSTITNDHFWGNDEQGVLYVANVTLSYLIIGGRTPAHPAERLKRNETPSRLCKSIDHGKTWTYLQDSELPQIAIARSISHRVSSRPYYYEFKALDNDPNVVLAFSQDLYRSLDGGQHFSKIETLQVSSNNLPSKINIISHPLQVNTLYLHSDLELHRSLDGGVTWVKINPQDWFYSLRLNPNDPDHLTLITNPSFYNESQLQRYQSFDRGDNWTFIEEFAASELQLPFESIEELKFNTAQPAVLYAYHRGTAQYSGIENSVRWTSTEFSHNVGYTFAPSKPEVMYSNNLSSLADSEIRIFKKSLDAGKTWIDVESRKWETAICGFSPDFQLTQVAVDASSSQTVYASILSNEQTKRSGVVRSDDGGLSWYIPNWDSIEENPSCSVQNTSIRKLYAHPWQTGQIYTVRDFGTAEADLLEQNSEYWQNNRIDISFDGGKNWQSADLSNVIGHIETVLFDAEDANTLYMLTSSEKRTYVSDTAYQSSPQSRLYQSQNGGMQWLMVGSLFGNGEVITGLAAHPQAGNILYMALSPYVPVGFVDDYQYSANRLLKSTDGGNSWQRLEINNQGAPLRRIHDLKILAHDNVTRLYAATETGVLSLNLP